MPTFLILLFTYFVSFIDKPQSAEPCLSSRAIEQRGKWDIGIDELDLPVNAIYLDSLRQMGVHIHHWSRWFNGATCEMSDSLAERVGQLHFVTEVEITRDNSTPKTAVPKRQLSDLDAGINNTFAEVVDLTDKQLALYNLKPLHEAGFEGQDILMTVCDGGFYNVSDAGFLRSTQDLGHFDFTDDEDDFEGSTGTHGTMCLSTISGLINDPHNGGYHGAATRAEYYLMRSEEAVTESPKEMDNLVAALEKSDSLGVNIFSVSLGYMWFDRSEWTLDKENDLDGRTTRCSRAATIAARKGMLVCASAGNEGNNEWHHICSPADADSILTVGAVGIDSVAGVFSSYGPSSDGRVKPEVCAVGVQTWVCQPVGYMAVTRNGTSFANPLLAGLAASLWSALPDENAMQIRERIIRSAHHHSMPDTQNQTGYGIPDAWLAYTMSLTPVENIYDEADRPRKILRGEQVLILRHGHVYNLAGQRIE